MSATELLLCTDMDRTVIPNGIEPEDSEARPHLRRLARRADVCLVYVSGRDIGRVEQAIVDFALPEPAFVISDVGTCLFRRHGQSWQPCTDWSTHIAIDWAVMTGPEIMTLLQEVPGIVAQEEDRQSAFKVSFYTGVDLEQDLLTTLASRLEAAGLRSNLVWSIDEPARRGLLDVLPASASKLHAIRFLQEQLRVRDDHVVFAGDSGNDMEVLVSDINSVLVRNASPQVRETALRRAQENGTQNSLYLAEGGPSPGMNGNYAAGVIEGVLHFVPALRDFVLEDAAAQTRMHTGMSEP